MIITNQFESNESIKDMSCHRSYAEYRPIQVDAVQTHCTWYIQSISHAIDVGNLFRIETLEQCNQRCSRRLLPPHATREYFTISESRSSARLRYSCWKFPISSSTSSSAPARCIDHSTVPGCQSDFYLDIDCKKGDREQNHRTFRAPDELMTFQLDVLSSSAPNACPARLHDLPVCRPQHVQVPAF